MLIENILPDQLSPLLFALKVAAGIIDKHPIPEGQPQILELHPVQIDMRDVKNPICPLQDRGREDLPHRNVDVSHTILEPGHVTGIRSRKKLYCDVRLVSPLTLNMDPLPLI